MRCDWCWLVGVVRSCVVQCFAWSVLACIALFMFLTGGIDLSHACVEACKVQLVCAPIRGSHLRTSAPPHTHASPDPLR